MLSMRRQSILIALPFFVLIAVAMVMAYRSVRQEQLNQSLLDAVHTHDVAAAERALRQGADPNTDEEVWTESAFGQKQPTRRERWARLWARLRVPNRYPDRPVLVAAAFSLPTRRTQDIALVNLLLAHGADVNARGPKGATALMSAVISAQKGDTTLVSVLLDAGAQAEVQVATGVTALGYARDFGSPELVRLLREAGATRYGNR
jgi:hypothetical protein